MEFCSHFEQIADPPNFLRELALKFCFRQKSLKLRHSSNWAANLFKIWQNSNAAFSVAYLFFIIYQKSKVWTITGDFQTEGNVIMLHKHLDKSVFVSFFLTHTCNTINKSKLYKKRSIKYS